MRRAAWILGGLFALATLVVLAGCGGGGGGGSAGPSVDTAGKPAPAPIKPALAFTRSLSNSYLSWGLFLGGWDAKGTWTAWQLTKPGKTGWMDAEAAWNPADQTSLAFVRRLDPGRRIGDVYTVNTQTGVETRAYAYSSGDPRPPFAGLAWFPSGDMLLYASGDAFVAIDLTKSPRTFQTLELGQWIWESGGSISLGPDLDPAPGYQGLLAFASQGLRSWGGRYGDGNGDLWVMKLAVDPVSRVVSLAWPQPARWSWPDGQTSCAWDAPGQRLGFVGGVGTAEPAIEWTSVTPVEGGVQFGTAPRICATNSQCGIGIHLDFGPTWSPDGAWLAFGGDFDVYRVRADGTSLAKVAATSARELGSAWNPHWTP